MRNTAFLVVIVAAIAVASYLGFQAGNAGELKFALTMGVPTVALAVVAVVLAQRDGALYRRSSFDDQGGAGWLNVRGGDFTRGFASAALLFGLAYAFTKLATPPASIRESWLVRLYLQLGDPSVLRKHVALVVAGIVVLSVAEELIWRGLVTSLLAERVGSRRAWVWAAVLYALAHLPTIWALRDPVAGPNPLLPVMALAAGLVWGYMAHRFERLLPGIFSHILFDWTVLMMFPLWGPSV